MKCANCGHTESHNPTCDHRSGPPEYPEYCKCSAFKKQLSINPHLINVFKKTVLQFGEQIDPGNEHDWFSLAYGWFLGQQGVSIDDARDAAWEVSHGEPLEYDDQ